MLLQGAWVKMGFKILFIFTFVYHWWSIDQNKIIVDKQILSAWRLQEGGDNFRRNDSLHAVHR